MKFSIVLLSGFVHSFCFLFARDVSCEESEPPALQEVVKGNENAGNETPASAEIARVTPEMQRELKQNPGNKKKQGKKKKQRKGKSKRTILKAASSQKKQKAKRKSKTKADHENEPEVPCADAKRAKKVKTASKTAGEHEATPDAPPKTKAEHTKLLAKLGRPLGCPKCKWNPKIGRKQCRNPKYTPRS